jgi:hypothetical protein
MVADEAGLQIGGLLDSAGTVNKDKPAVATQEEGEYSK